MRVVFACAGTGGHVNPAIAIAKIMLKKFKDVEVLFEGFEVPKKEIPKLDEYIITFGKHNGKTLPQIAECDANWIAWAKENINREPVRTLLAQM